MGRAEAEAAAAAAAASARGGGTTRALKPDHHEHQAGHLQVLYAWCVSGRKPVPVLT